MKFNKTISAALAAGAIVSAGLAFAAPANALACGTPALLVNGISDTDTNQLVWYSPAGDVLETVPMGEAQGYGDIALSQDGLTVYGVQNSGGPDGDVIDVVDAATGVVKSTITITGDAAGVGSWDGAAVLSDGKLAIGSGSDQRSFKIDLSTGASTVFGDAGSGVYTTTGDFADLGDGDELWLVTNNDSVVYQVARIHADGTVTIVGELDGEAWGAGRVNNDIYLALADGTIKKIAIADIPTAAGTSTLAVSDVVDSGAPASLWGAAGTQDSGTQVCKPAELAETGNSTLTVLGAVVPMMLLGGAATVFALRRRNS